MGFFLFFSYDEKKFFLIVSLFFAIVYVYCLKGERRGVLKKNRLISNVICVAVMRALKDAPKFRLSGGMMSDVAR